MLTGKIKNQIDEIWETIWTGGISNPLSVIEQISYLLFIKRLDEIHSQKERIAQRTKKPIVEPIFSEAQRELRWSVFRDKDPQTLYVIVRDKAFPFIKTLQGEESRFAKHMEDAIFMMPDASLLDRVIQMIDDIDMKDRDTKGDVYEYLLSKIATAGVNGQFRTPRHIIKMMVAMLKPTLKDTMCDPASGTCGFLMATAEYINQHYPKELTRPEHRTHYNSNLFTGFDFDTHMLRIGAMNMMLHGIEQPRIEYRDSLAEVHDGEEAITEAYSLILANPPFKGSVNVDNISPDLLKALGKVKPTKPSSEAVDKNGKKKKRPTEKSELLFLALIIRQLTKGGRAAVIVPDGVLFGSTKAHKEIRKKLVDEQKLDAVISMPSGVFKPYAGVSTAVLVFTKTDAKGTDKVWFYDMQADGFSLDDKRTPLVKDGETITHSLNNIPDILTRWDNLADEHAHARTAQSFMVDKEAIVNNGYDLSINRYKEVVYEEVEYDAPKVIMERIKALQGAMDNGMTELEGMLE